MADTEEDVALDAHAADLSEEQREMGLKLARLVIDGKLEEARTVARRIVEIEAEIEVAHAAPSRPATGTTSEGGRRGPWTTISAGVGSPIAIVAAVTYHTAGADVC